MDRMVRRLIHDVGAVFERDEGGEIMQGYAYFCCGGMGVHAHDCPQVSVYVPGAARNGLSFSADTQLQRDIEAARGVKPYEAMADEPVGGAVNHPKHYNKHGSGIECIDVVEHMGFNLGNAIKYIWRADLKGDAIEDLKKASWYIEREIKKRAK